MSKISAIVMLVIVSLNLVKLVFFDGYVGGKVYVESNVYTIIMMLIFAIMLWFYALKFKD